eukprot:TRINITY_DN27812_c0_g1_i1.p1 TRINITY_DN27812_c0_g1~~TRINITY_DN27812_c0_g1_i1.p1  ORF type:complete len:245 (-),score=28.35 TRINITY_DN27812_c0_g1_i1:35-769(-)
MAAKPAGSFLYEEGHRLCVLGGGDKNFRKTDLQGAFNEFGHIIQIETPKAGLAFVVFKDKGDAKEAMEVMDGKSVNGSTITVNWAGPKPTSKPQTADDRETPASERTNFGIRKEVLTTTTWERAEAWERNAKRKAARNRNSRSPSGRRMRSRSGRGEQRRRSRSRSDRRGRGKSRSERRGNGRSRSERKARLRSRSERRARGRSRSERKARSRSRSERRGRGRSVSERRGGGKRGNDRRGRSRS